MVEKFIFYKKRSLIQFICGYIGYIGVSYECEKKIIFVLCSDDCNVCEKELLITVDHLICHICYDKLQKILKKERSFFFICRLIMAEKLIIRDQKN